MGRATTRPRARAHARNVSIYRPVANLQIADYYTPRSRSVERPPGVCAGCSAEAPPGMEGSPRVRPRGGRNGADPLDRRIADIAARQRGAIAVRQIAAPDPPLAPGRPPRSARRSSCSRGRRRAGADRPALVRGCECDDVDEALCAAEVAGIARYSGRFEATQWRQSRDPVIGRLAPCDQSRRGPRRCDRTRGPRSRPRAAARRSPPHAATGPVAARAPAGRASRGGLRQVPRR